MSAMSSFGFYGFIACLTLFRMGFLGAAHESPPPLPKICHTYPTMTQLGSYTSPKEDPKNI